MITSSSRVAGFLQALATAVISATASATLFAGTPPVRTLECSVNAEVSFKTFSSSREKKGFDTFSATSPPRRYQTMEVTEEASAGSYPFTAAPYIGPHLAAPGSFTYHVSVSGTATVYYNRYQASASVVSTNYRQTTLTNASDSDGPRSIGTNALGQRPGIDFSGGTVSGRIDYEPATLSGSQTISVNQNCTTATSNFNGGLVVLGASVGTVLGPTEATTNTPTGYTPALRRYILNNEYETTDLLNDCLSDLYVCSIPSGWSASYNQCTGVCSTNSGTSPLAIRNLSTNELSVSLQRVEYRFSFQGDRNVSYIITWDEKTSLIGTEPTYVHRRLQLQGHGQKVNTETFFLDPPPANGNRLVTNIRVVRADECEDCGAEPKTGPQIAPSRIPGDGQVGLDGGVRFSMSLGNGGFGIPAGTLWLAQNRPSAQLATPSVLNSAADTNLVQVTTDGNGIRTVVAPQMFADVLATNFGFAINCYAISNGVWLTNQAPTTTWTFSNPDASSTTTNRFRIVQTVSAFSITNDYTWNSVTATWTLSAGNGLRTNTQHISWDTGFSNRTETFIVRNPDSTVAEKRVRKFRVFSWGEALTEEIVDPDTLAFSTAYTYTVDGKLETLTRSDGYWENRTYSGSRPSYVSTPYLNYRTNFSEPGTPYNYVYYFYGTNDVAAFGDAGAFEPDTPRSIEVRTLPGSGFNRFQVILADEKRLIEGNHTTSGDKVVTVIRYFTNGPFNGRIREIVQPDGTVQLYAYESGGFQLTNTISVGEYDAGSGVVTNGVRTVIISDTAGNFLSKTAFDVSTGLMVGAETNSFDARGRQTRTTYLDGTFQSLVYSWSGLGLITNRAGSIIELEHDALKRLTAETQFREGQALATRFAYDAANRVTSVTRVGTNGTNIVQWRFRYDGLGRMVAATNANSVATTCAYLWTNGTTIKTTTFAAGTGDSGTEIETFARDGTLVALTGDAAFPTRFTNINGYATHRVIPLNHDGTDTSMYWESQMDQARRLTDVNTSKGVNYPQRKFTYNGLNQITREESPDGIQLFTYNKRGELETNAFDAGNNGIVLASDDRITRRTNDVAVKDGITVWRTRTYQWTTNSNATATRLITTETSIDGRHRWEVIDTITNHQEISFLGNGIVELVATIPDGSALVRRQQHGRLISETLRDRNGGTVSSVALTYDAFDRQHTAIHSRNGATTNTYDSLDRLKTIASPQPAVGQTSQVTELFYDNRDRVIRILFADGSSQTNTYTPAGQVSSQSGSRIIPVQYVYDAQGRLKTNTTWRGGVPQHVWFSYNAAGLLSGKHFADGTSNTFTYGTGARNQGRVTSTTNARNQVTAYSYNDSFGELQTITFDNPNLEPTTRFSYDRLGRLALASKDPVTLPGQTNAFAYSLLGNVVAETNTYAGYVVNSSFDTLYRRSGLTLTSNTVAVASSSFGFDAAGRLAAITNGAFSAVYTFVPQLPDVVESLTARQSTTNRLFLTRQYDNLERATSIVASVPGLQPLRRTYAYNDLNQRTRATSEDLSRWDYKYDQLGQLTNAVRSWSSGNPVPGQQFRYEYDEVGNRTASFAGGNSSGTALRSFGYGANALNQYTNRTIPNSFDVLGVANESATVTVNGGSVYRHGEYFWKELTANNSAGATNVAVTNVASLSGTTNRIGTLLLDRTNLVLAYDADGNLTNDGRWSYAWDSQNRLTNIVSTTNVADINRVKLDFIYDAFGRRTQKIFATNDFLGFSKQYTNTFIYDGDLLVAEVDHSRKLLRSYVWATREKKFDSELLAVIEHTNGNAAHFAISDTIGNAVALVQGASGSISSRYEYGPFGELIRSSGTFATQNPFRFGGQFTDEETGHTAFRHRYYAGSSGRWLSRDPLGEIDGPNLYGFVRNDPVNGRDPFGLWAYFQPSTWFDGRGYQPGALEDFNGQVAQATLDPFIGNYFRRNGGYDPCDETLRISYQLGRFSRDTLLQAGVLRIAGLAASGRTLAHVLVSEGAVAYELAQSVESIASGIERVEAGDNWGLLDIAAGSLGLKGGLGQIGTGTRAYGSRLGAERGALTKVPNFANNRLAAEHYAKHVKGVIDKGGMQTVKAGGADMAEFASFKDYVQAARKFNSGPTPSGVLEGVRGNGDILRFDSATGYFGIRTPEGTIRTFFRPDEGVGYFYKQFK